MNRFKKTDWILLGVIFAIALILRQVIQIRLFPDSIEYMTFARNIYSGIHNTGDIHIGALRRPPLYPHLIAWLSNGDVSSTHLIAVARQISILCGALLVVPVYMLGRRMLGVTAAFTAALITALTPEFLYYSGAILTESISTLFIMIAMALVWHVSDDKASKILTAAAGVFFGLAFLSRNAVIGFLPIGIAWILIPLLKKGMVQYRNTLKKKGVLILILTGMFFLIISPQVLYLHSETGGWHLAVDPFGDLETRMQQAGKDIRYTSSSEAIASLTQDSEKFIWETQKTKGLVSTALSNPTKYFKAYVTTFLNGYLPDTHPLPYPSVILILAAVGILGLILRKQFRTLIFCFWSFAGYYAFLSLFLNMRDRYMFPAFPFLVFLAGAGSWYLSELVITRFKDHTHQKTCHWITIAILSVLITWFLAPASTALIKEQNRVSDFTFWDKLGKDISRRIEPGSIIIDRTPHIPFFAGGIRTNPPFAEIPNVIHFAQARGIKYWVVSSFYVPKLRPQFTALLNPENEHPSLKPISIYPLDRGQKIIIYRIK